RQLNAHVRTMRLCADEEIDRWPVGKPFTLLPAMQAITLNVMLRAVFGYEAGPQREELAARVRSMIDPLARPRGAIALRADLRGRDDARAAQSFEMRRRAVDDLLYAEITRRRADPGLAARDDVFSTLLLARDSSDQGLSDREVRDELLTLLLAGHETTATGLAWTLDLLLHDRKVMQRAQQRDPSYLDAVIKESLRVRTVIPGVGRVVREQPFSLGTFTVPPGMEINPSIRTIHRRADLYPQPRSFRPERFLGADAPDTYTWLPFGGGTRRCLGASFALTEMRIVLARILERTHLVPVDRRPARRQFRLVTLGPRGGVRAIQEAAPVPGEVVTPVQVSWARASRAMYRSGRARCGLALIVVMGLLLARANPAAARGLPAVAGTGTTLQRWGHDALSVLGGIGLLALALLGFITAALLAAVILLRFPPITAAARWLSQRRFSAVDLYTPRLSRWLWKPLARMFVRSFVWLVGLRVRVENFKASDDQDATAHQLNAVVRSVLGAGGVTPATGTSWLVTTPLGSAGLLADMADALRDVPQGKGIAAA